MRNKTGIVRILQLFFPYFIVVGVFQLLAYSILDLKTTASELLKTSYQHLIVSTFTFLGNFFILWLFVKYVDKEDFKKIGFQSNQIGKEFRSGFLISLFIMLVALFVVFYFENWNLPIIHFKFYDIVTTIIIFFLGAITEELLVRGYILKNLMISFNKYIALIISSFLFALMHLANPYISFLSFTDLFIAGVFLGISYIFTKKLWFPIALHFSWNLFQTFFGFNVSGQNFYSILEFKTKTSNLLIGDDFGFEGSILSIVLQIIFIVGIWFYYRNQERIKV